MHPLDITTTDNTAPADHHLFIAPPDLPNYRQPLRLLLSVIAAGSITAFVPQVAQTAAVYFVKPSDDRATVSVRFVVALGAKGETSPFKAGQVLVFFGEIPNMPGHAIVADQKTGKLYSGYHTERFEQIPDDET